jgi:hypothetical protein
LDVYRIAALFVPDADPRYAKMAASSPYADALRREVAHAPVEPSKSEEMRQAEQRLKEERIEPELVAAITQQGSTQRYIIRKRHQAKRYRLVRFVVK